MIGMFDICVMVLLKYFIFCVMRMGDNNDGN